MIRNNMKYFTTCMHPMKTSRVFAIALLMLPFVLISCRGQLSDKPPVHLNPNMDNQRRFEAQEKNEFFSDNRSMRPPVEGTVPRNSPYGNYKGYYQGGDEGYRGSNADTLLVENPVELTRSFLYRGQDRYDIYCAPCHGGTGAGDGIIMVNQYGFVPAPTFHQDRIRELSDGELFSIITNGIRTMPPYAHQVKVEDRWAIVAYIRALQRSQHVPESDMERYDVDLTQLREQYEIRMQAEQEAAEAAEKAAGADEEVSAARGEEMFTTTLGCQACHSIDGTDGIGPTLAGIMGREETMQDGTTLTVDEEYLVESIVSPNAKVVEGYQPVMAPFSYLSSAEVESLIEYIKTLSDNQ